MFVHCPPKILEELETSYENNKRYYHIPNGKKYPSITSILSSFDKPELLKWKKRIGEKEADKITKESTNKGTKVHSLLEQYLKNEKIIKDSIDVMDNFFKLKPYINNINNIHYLEAPLYSNYLKVAGRTDCIGEYNGKLSIIDFKTSRKLKKEEWIIDYFLQCTFYCIAYYELTGIKINQMVILIAVEHEYPQIYIKPIKNYIIPLKTKIKTYYNTLC